MNPIKIKIQLTVRQEFSSLKPMYLFIEDAFNYAHYRFKGNEDNYLYEAEKIIIDKQKEIKDSLISFHNSQTDYAIEFSKILALEISDLTNTELFASQSPSYEGYLNYIIESEEHILEAV